MEYGKKRVSSLQKHKIRKILPFAGPLSQLINHKIKLFQGFRPNFGEK